MTIIKVKPFGHSESFRTPKEIPESDIEANLGDLSDLERYFGFTDFRDKMGAREFNSRCEIWIPELFINEDRSTSYHWDKYTIVDQTKIADTTFNGIDKPRKRLRAIHWYLKRDVPL